MLEINEIFKKPEFNLFNQFYILEEGNQLIKELTVVFLILILSKFSLFGQCAGPFLEPNCSDPGAIELYDGAVINPGEVFIVTTSITLNTVTINGGTLIICGSLSIDAMNFVSGNVTIVSSGSLTLANTGIANVFGNNCTLLNFGILNSFCSIVTGNNNLIANCTYSSILNIPFNQLVVMGSNSQVINQGFITTNYVVNLSNNTIPPFCLESGSVLNVGYMINQYPNGFNATSSSSCINITTGIINSAQMTDSSNVVICYNEGNVSISGDPMFGSAVIDSNCASCGVALGIKLITFESQVSDNGIDLKWQMESISDLLMIEIQKIDPKKNVEFDHLCFVNPNMQNSDGEFNYTDTEVLTGNTYYYRLRFITIDGNEEFSKTISEQFHKNNLSLLYPNPTNQNHFNVLKGVQIKKIKTIEGIEIPFEQFAEFVVLNQKAFNTVLIVSFDFKDQEFIERLTMTNL